MSANTKYDHILSLLESALPLIQIEISKQESGIQAVDSLPSLRFIKGRLEDIEKMIRSGSVRKDERYEGSMGHLVVDTWPLNDPLGKMILEIEQSFYRLK